MLHLTDAIEPQVPHNPVSILKINTWSTRIEDYGNVQLAVSVCMRNRVVKVMESTQHTELATKFSDLDFTLHTVQQESEYPGKQFEVLAKEIIPQNNFNNIQLRGVIQDISFDEDGNISMLVNVSNVSNRC